MNLYRICYRDFSQRRSYVNYVNSNFLNNSELLKKNNLTKPEIQSFLDKKNIYFFYNYDILNEKIFSDVKKLFLHRILAGDFLIQPFEPKTKLCFITKDYQYPNTFLLYKHKILNLTEIKKLHSIFSNYKEGKDYYKYEYLLFKNHNFANKVMERIKNYPHQGVYYYTIIA